MSPYGPVMQVAVANTPDYCVQEVAARTIAMVRALARRLPGLARAVRDGRWSATGDGAGALRPSRATVAVVGFGRIGSLAAAHAAALGFRVVVHDPNVAEAAVRAAGHEPVELDEALAAADVVTLHVPLTDRTRHLLNGAAIARMRPGAHLVNASRGTVVDILALASALREGHLGGAAVDVFPVEPKGPDEAFESPLRGLDNVLLTPHVGGSTLEAQDNIGVEVAAKLIRYSDNGSTLSAVNFPEVALPGHEGSRRILHIHRNVPGVLSRANELFGERGINIDGQYLRTDAQVGYVVIDVTASEEQAAELRNALAGIPGTIRTRVLY